MAPKSLRICQSIVRTRRGAATARVKDNAGAVVDAAAVVDDARAVVDSAAVVDDARAVVDPSGIGNLLVRERSRSASCIVSSCSWAMSETVACTGVKLRPLEPTDQPMHASCCCNTQAQHIIARMLS